MKKFFTVILAIIYLLISTPNLVQAQGMNSPKDLFDMSQVLDVSTLQTQIIRDLTVQKFGEDIRVLDIKFFSHTWQSVDLSTTARIIIPSNIPTENLGKAVITQSGTSALDPAINFEDDFGVKTALMFDLPVMLCACSIPTQSFGYVSETEMARDYRLQMMADGDTTKEIAYPLANFYLRAMTAFGSLDQAGNPTEFVITGSSKRGLAQWIATAVDSRVKGFMSNAYNAPDGINYWNLVKKDWGTESMLGNADTWLEWLKTDAGIEYANLYDPYYFKNLITVPAILNVGSNDNLYPVESANTIFPTLINQQSFEMIPNYPHGMGSLTHLANWQTIIDRAFFNRKTPTISLNTTKNNDNNLVIKALITNTEEVKAVKLYSSVNYNNISADLKTVDAQWTGVEMTNTQNNIYEATLTLTDDEKIAYYIEIEDVKNNISAFNSSLIKVGATVDAPVSSVALNNLPSNPTNQTSVDITVSGDGLVTYNYILEMTNNNAGGVILSSDININTPIHLDFSSDSRYTLTVTGKDIFGNQSEPAIYKWTTDFTAPVFGDLVLTKKDGQIKNIFPVNNEYIINLDSSEIKDFNDNLTDIIYLYIKDVYLDIKDTTKTFDVVWVEADKVVGKIFYQTPEINPQITSDGWYFALNQDVQAPFTVGKNSFRVSVSDLTGNTATATITLTTTDSIPPAITLNGGNLEITQGSTYSELGATATDNLDANIQIIIAGDTVNTTTAGVYKITYNTVDSSGNKAVEIIRVVTVTAVTAPTPSGGGGGGSSSSGGGGGSSNGGGGGSSNSNSGGSGSSGSSSSNSGSGSTIIPIIKKETIAPIIKTEETKITKEEESKVVVLGVEADERTIQLLDIASDAKNIHSGNIQQQKNTEIEKTGYNNYTAKLINGVENLSTNNIEAITNFAVYGTKTTQILGAGERAGVINSYKSAFGKLPTTQNEWEDVVKIANGRWPSQANPEAENRAKSGFEKIYKRKANMNNPNDNAAVTVMAYGLRPDKRNLNSEKSAIKTFKNIYKYNPVSATDWDIVRAIAYSGAVR